MPEQKKGLSDFYENYKAYFIPAAMCSAVSRCHVRRYNTENSWSDGRFYQ